MPKAIFEQDDKIVSELLQTEKMDQLSTYDIVPMRRNPGAKRFTRSFASSSTPASEGISKIAGDHGEILLEMSLFLTDKGQKLTPTAHAECEEMF